MMKRYEKYKDSGVERLGEIPEHWKIFYPKYHLRLNKGKNPKELVQASDLDPYLAMDFLRSRDNKTVYYPKDKKGLVWVDNDELLILWDGANAGEVIKSKKGYLSSTMAVVGFDRWLFDSSFMYYFLKGNERIFKDFSSGTTIPHFDSDILLDEQYAFPIICEQQTIARYLDYTISKIEQLIFEKEVFIKKLQEKRKALINEIVTKGLDPNAHMLDSGIEWLGMVPSHWEIKRIGLNASIVRGGSPRPAGDSRFFNGNYIPWITVKEVTSAVGNYITHTESYLTFEGSLNSRIIEPETLLMSNSGATLGVPKISKIRGCINDGSVAFTSFSECLERDFLMLFFETHTDIYRDEMKGNGQPNLNTEIIKNTPMPTPPIREQLEIIKKAENIKIKIDDIILKLQLQNQKLKEYKTAVISEVITGKVDVSEWKAPVA